MTEEKGGTSKYAKLGVDAGKQDVRNTFLRYIENDYPRAFVNIIRDPSNPGWVETQHMDGDGSKFVQRLLNFAETGNPEVIRGAPDDALQMNLGDIAASGFVFGRIIVTDVINVNGLTVPKKVVTEQISQRFAELLQMYRDNGFDIHWLGGETADLPTQVKSITFDVAVHARAKENDIIKGNIEPGDRIYGYASDGHAAWETDTYNTGIMSNGLTLARVGTIWSGYEKKYPHLGPQHGKYKVGEKAGLPNNMAVSDALISPTRQWAILIKMLIEKLKATDTLDLLHGISMNTGGGATKVSNIGKGILYRKDMPTPPEFFQFIQRETGEEWKDMFRGFNCGVGLDIVGKDTPLFKEILQVVSMETKVKLYELGKCEASSDTDNHVILETPYGTFNY